MVFLTGDTHGGHKKITRFCNRFSLDEDDIVVILGDVGANYYGDPRDEFMKIGLDHVRPTIFCLHGNHEMRPSSLPTYKQKVWHGGTVWYEEGHPKILFARDGDIFDLDGQKCIVLGGAYSVDKYYRLLHGLSWFSDEQPSQEIKDRAEATLESVGWQVDLVLSHTCPAKYIPAEAFIPGLDQSLVDRSTESWLDAIEDRLQYRQWFCGHWHIDKHIDRMDFLMHSFKCIDGSPIEVLQN